MMGKESYSGKTSFKSISLVTKKLLNIPDYRFSQKKIVIVVETLPQITAKQPSSERHCWLASSNSIKVVSEILVGDDVGLPLGTLVGKGNGS